MRSCLTWASSVGIQALQGSPDELSLLINDYDMHPDPRARPLNCSLLAPRGLVGGRVQLDTRPLHAPEDTLPDGRYMLPDTSSEHDTVTSTQHAEVGTHVLARSVAVEIERKLRLRGGVGRELAEIRDAAREAGDPCLPIE